MTPGTLALIAVAAFVWIFIGALIGSRYCIITGMALAMGVITYSFVSVW